MITLKYANLRDPSFNQSLFKLTNYNAFPTTICIIIARLKKALDDESSTAQEEYTKLLKKYSLLDAKGDFVPKDNEPNTFQIIPEKQAEWEKEFKEFQAFEFKIEKNKIPLTELKDVKMSPQDFLNLEPIIAVDEEAPAKLTPVA